jgi:hypothetical protein
MLAENRVETQSQPIPCGVKRNVEFTQTLPNFIYLLVLFFSFDNKAKTIAKRTLRQGSKTKILPLEKVIIEVFSYIFSP